MLYNLILSRSEAGKTIAEWIEYAAMAIEILAVVIIVVAIFYSVGRYLYERVRGEVADDPYGDLKARLGGSMLLGLEILVAADIVRTVALDTTLQSVAILGLLVLIRTFLSWSIDIELEGRWPWQGGRDKGPLT
jgi:uncharacterized membrane protein